MSDAEREAIARAAARHRGLTLVVLFGSRARGEATERSDWDLGYVGSAGSTSRSSGPSS
jgi:predicted nucleotidyltransferase